MEARVKRLPGQGVWRRFSVFNGHKNKPLTGKPVTDTNHERPQTRADCQPGGRLYMRPCPYVGCRHHLWSDQPTSEAFSVNTDFIDAETGEFKDSALSGARSCALDSVKLGRAEYGSIAFDLSLNWSRVQQVEIDALRKFKAGCERAGLDVTAWLDGFEPWEHNAGRF